MHAGFTTSRDTYLNPPDGEAEAVLEYWLQPTFIQAAAVILGCCKVAPRIVLTPPPKQHGEVGGCYMEFQTRGASDWLLCSQAQVEASAVGLFEDDPEEPD